MWATILCDAVRAHCTQAVARAAGASVYLDGQFAGQTPLSYMIAGGLPAMQIVRRLLDARRAGR